MNLFFWGIVFVIVGLSSASSFIIKRRPDHAERLNQITKISRWAGALLLILGVLRFLGAWDGIAYWQMFSWFKVLNISLVGKIAFILYIPLSIVLGYLEAFVLIEDYILTPKESGEISTWHKIYNRLSKYCNFIGLLGVALGLVLILMHFRIINVFG